MTSDIVAFLRRGGLCGAAEAPHAEPLAGGVSSDIWRVDLRAGPVCVKRALPRLRVAQRWEAPVSRNAYEYEWFRIAGEAVPHAVPRVLYREEGCFAMEYLDPERHPLWKALLRQGKADAPFAAQVGATLAAIHTATAGRSDVARLFASDAIFHAIRLEPYLVATAARHADVAQPLASLVERTARTRICLVHGDVSPKNILAGPAGPVFLDAECAWYGDPAFDLAFCLNHLLLKCLWVPAATAQFLACFDALGRAYLEAVSFEGVKERAASLLPGLLLARVDGKSPVEYLTDEAQKDFVRRMARSFLKAPAASLAAIRSAWQESLT